MSVTLPRLRAPQGDGELLAYPELADVPHVVERNRSSLAAATVSIDGVPLAELRRFAIRDVVTAARAYLGEKPSSPFPTSLVMAGHQPEFFHPGVWIKNFASNHLARRCGATALNLVVDNDTLKSPSLRIPIWSQDPDQVRSTTVAFDHATGEVPFEEREVADSGLFESFPRRVADLTGPWPFRPVLPDLWRVAIATQGTIGERIARARRSLEQGWGCETLEVPMSRVCATDAFLRFARALVRDLPRFADGYNRAVHEYRRRHRIRSRNHPVPDLVRDGDWAEAPFWGWRAGTPRRQRVFVQRVGDRATLRCGTEIWGDLPVSGDLAEWRALDSTGRKLRTRALTTTLFARLFLADLFIHGIGGGTYDELTDDIVRNHFGIEPPGFLILTATHRLPLPRFAATAESLRQAESGLRDLQWNPQRNLPARVLQSGAVAGLLSDRERSRADRPRDPAARRAWFVQLRENLVALQAGLPGEITKAAIARRSRAASEVRANEVTARRDYSFALYPAEMLREAMTGSLGR